jgi:hypothetical protein
MTKTRGSLLVVLISAVFNCMTTSPALGQELVTTTAQATPGTIVVVQADYVDADGKPTIVTDPVVMVLRPLTLDQRISNAQEDLASQEVEIRALLRAHDMAKVRLAIWKKNGIEAELAALRTQQAALATAPDTEK